MQRTVRSGKLDGYVREGSRRLLWAGTFVSILTLAVTLTAGLTAFFATPRFDHFGDGPGGLGGIPSLTFLACAALGLPMLLYGLVSVARGVRRDAWYVLCAALPWVTGLGYFFVSHAFDPCALGLIDENATFLQAPMCTSWEGRPETSSRLHLLHHSLTPTLPLVTLQWLLLRKYGRA